jgi:hypothetical protein
MNKSLNMLHNVLTCVSCAKTIFDSVVNRDRKLWQGHVVMYVFDTSDVNNIKLIMHYAYGDNFGIRYGNVELPINEFRAWSMNTTN